jgi:hypothetical protein
MNKLITFPMAIMVILCFVGLAMTLGGWNTVPGPGGGAPGVNGTTVPGWNVQTWDLSTATSIIVVAVGLGLLIAFLGLSVFGTSVLSDTGQVMAFKTLGYFGLYWALSVGSSWAFNSIPVWGNLAWIMMTVMFSLGFMMDIRSGGV